MTKQNTREEFYGLNWFGKSQARRSAGTKTLTTLKEDKEHNQKELNKDSKNLIIEGDNLDALKHLMSTHKGKVKVIYIDPPYNTKNGDKLIYEDKREATVSDLVSLKGGKFSKEEAEKLFSWDGLRSYEHSSWLSFVFPRLLLARQLLHPKEGVMFVSVNSNMASQLKLVLNEIFKELNGLTPFIWEANPALNQCSRHVGGGYEVILCFAYCRKYLPPFMIPRGLKQLKSYINPDNDPNGLYRLDQLTNKRKENRADRKFPIVSPSGIIYSPPVNVGWNMSLERFKELEQAGRIVWRDDEKKLPRVKTYLKDIREGVVAKSLLLAYEVGGTVEGSMDLKKLFGGVCVFDYPKPVRLLKYLIGLGTSSNAGDIVLDFFAGSGTTGQAVMELNKSDNGNRSFILVNLPEEISDDRNPTAYRYIKDIVGDETPNLCHITRLRVGRAGRMLKECSGLDVGFKLFRLVEGDKVK